MAALINGNQILKPQPVITDSASSTVAVVPLVFGKTGQTWTLVEAKEKEKKTYYIQNALNKQALTLNDNAAGSEVVQESLNHSTSQRWTIEEYAKAPATDTITWEMPPLNLKQRLAALSVSPSSPTSSHGQEPRSPIFAKRKFNPPWVKRPQHENNYSEGDSGMVEEAMAKMIFQAGVDFE
ncbi:hypothetical protein H0H81_004595 [Sphagnurus paluster]|uniref:Ricin B lectin domain-containing protein n=1 Tax=Sphagnurus paluster TaxID=117069 RepID=A0A9P7K438_9AGAR|nr:hypothetical protein H0H81_004595 [Sphagnurus paluster]